MSQNIFSNPSVTSGPSTSGTGNGTVSIDKLTHFTISQTYTLTCVEVSASTIFSVAGSVDGNVGLAIVGSQFYDTDLKVFLTISQGSSAFIVGDSITFAVVHGTDVSKENFDSLYTEFLTDPTFITNTAFKVNDNSANTLFTVLANGNVGVGTAAPLYKFEVIGDVANNYLAKIISTHTTVSESFGLHIGAGTGSSDEALRISNVTGTAELMRVRGDGKVQIPALSPSSVVTTDSSSFLDTVALSSGGGPGTIMVRDANGNFSANNEFLTLQSTIRTVDTTSLTVASAHNQLFTGGPDSQTVVLPDTSTIPTGAAYCIINTGIGTLTVKSFDNSTILVLTGEGCSLLTCKLIGSNGADAWAYLYSPIFSSSNVASTGVLRDSSGNFSAGTITASLTGHASLDVAASSLGNLTDTGTDGIVVTGGTGAVVGTVSLAQHVADSSHNGYLTSTDWSTFNGKQNALGFTPENAANKGAASGYAPLDSSTKIPVAYLPSVVMEYQGAWDPSSNTPSLADGVGTNGNVYYVSTAFGSTVAGLADASMTNFQLGDLVIYSTSLGAWQLVTPAAGVSSVNGAQGAVTVNAINQLTGDATASAASGSQSKALTFATVNGSPGSFGSASKSLSATVNGKGLVTALSEQNIAIAESQVTNLTSDLAAKVATASLGNLTDSGVDGITITGGTGAVVGSVSISQHAAGTSNSGYLSNTDWNTFNGKLSSFSFASVGSSPNSAGGSASGSTITLQPADATNPGVITAGAQDIGGNKVFHGNVEVAGVFNVGEVTNSSTTGSNARLPSSASSNYILTDGSLVSIGSADKTTAAAGDIVTFTNDTGSSIIVVNNYASAASGEKIYTPAGANVLIEDKGSFILQYSATIHAWTMIGAPSLASANTASTGVFRDASGNFSAGTISATTVNANVSASTATATNGSSSRTLASHLGDWLNVKDFGATGDASTDDTIALQAAIATGRPLYWPAGGYVISDSLTLSDVTRVFWTGEGSSSYIINNAPASHPSLVLSSVRDFIIEKLSIIGQTAFPNHAIQINQLPATTETADGILRDLNLQPNGYGFVIDQSDLVTIENCKYWTGNNGLPASDSAGQRKHAVFVDIATSGQFFNAYTFRDCDFHGIDSSISGAACIKAGASLGSLDSLVIDNCELEGTFTCIDISGAYNMSLRNTYVENGTLLIANSRNCVIDSCFNPASIHLSSSCVQVIVKSGTVDNGTYTIDSGCFQCGSYDSLIGTLSDSGTNSTHINLRLGGVIQNDIVYGMQVGNLTASEAVFTDSSKNLVSVATTGSGNVVLATSPTLVTPALGTPSALVGTNITGTASGLTAGHVTTNANLTGVITSVGNATSIASQTGTGSTFVVDTSPTLVTPNLGTPSTLVGTNITGTASSLTAGHVTTNANLTGPITSSGNATSIASQTGTGTTFVMSASPTLSGTTSFPGSTIINGNGYIGINANPGSSNAFVVSTSLANAYLTIMTNSAGTGTSFGLQINAGTNSSDTALRVANNSGSALMLVNGDGSVFLANLTASQAVFTDASKNLVSVATTGSGSAVLATSPTLVTPALGTPSALVGTNITGTASGLTAGNVTTNANLTGVITSVGNATSIASQTGTGTKFVVDTSPTLITPDLGTPTALVGTNITGTASSLTAGHVTTNANLTGVITSSGNATSIASQTGTGTKFVVDTSPTLVTPNLGTPTTLVGTNITGTASGLTAGNVTTNANMTGDVTSVGNATTLAATQANITTISKSTGVAVHGTNTNDSAAAGYIGEYIESLTSSATNVPGANNAYADFGSISLTGGDWDVSAILDLTLNGATVTFMEMGIGTATGNASTGLVRGVNDLISNDIVNHTGLVIPPYRVTVASGSSPTTIYGKLNVGYSVTTPQYTGRISARRVR